MIVDLPDTTTSKISKKIMALREQGGVIALGRVLTLVVVTKSGLEEEAIEAANEASREHPCRIIVLADAGAERPDPARRADPGGRRRRSLRGHPAPRLRRTRGGKRIPRRGPAAAGRADRGLVAARRAEERLRDVDRADRAPPDHGLGQRGRSAAGAGEHPPHLQGRRHGPRLDPPDQLADPAGRGPGPGGRLARSRPSPSKAPRTPPAPSCSRPGSRWPWTRRSRSSRTPQAPGSGGCGSPAPAATSSSSGPASPWRN